MLTKLKEARKSSRFYIWVWKQKGIIYLAVFKTSRQHEF